MFFPCLNLCKYQSYTSSPDNKVNWPQSHVCNIKKSNKKSIYNYTYIYLTFFLFLTCVVLSQPFYRSTYLQLMMSIYLTTCWCILSTYPKLIYLSIYSWYLSIYHELGISLCALTVCIFSHHHHRTGPLQHNLSISHYSNNIFLSLSL